MTKVKMNFLILVAMLLLCVASTSGFAQQKSAADNISKSIVELAEEMRTKPLNELNENEQQVIAVERETNRLFQEGDVDKMMSHVALDSIVSPPGSEPSIGIENQSKAFKEAIKIDGLQLSWEPVDVFVGPSNDMAYALGLARSKMPNEPEELWKYLSVWEKQNGKWMNKVEMRNSLFAEPQYAVNSTSKSIEEIVDEFRVRPLNELNEIEQQLIAIERETNRVFQEGDVDKMMSHIALDAILCLPGSGPIIGKKNQRKIYNESVTIKGFQLSWEPIDAFVGLSNDMGYVLGLVKSRMPNEPEKIWKYSSVWEKKDGKWMNKFHIRNAIPVKE